jgi:RNA polymerase sigma factor (sigma-70 family)
LAIGTAAVPMGMETKSNNLLQLFTAEYARIVGLISRIVGCRTTAEDLAQDTFVKLWGRSLTQNDRGLLFRTAQNLAIDHLRAQRVRSSHADSIILDPLTDRAHAPDSAAREQLDILYQVLKRLPKRTQRIFLLNRLDGLSYAEIARLLGVSVSTVEKEIIRALDSCRCCRSDPTAR